MTKQEDANRLSPASELPDLSGAERESVKEQSRPGAALIHETIRAEGLSELDRTSSALLFSGFAAGLSMGFSLITEAALRARLPDTAWAGLVSKLGYSMGFLIVVMGRQQLFTENTLTPVLPLLHERSLHMVWRVLRLWALVLVANLAGAWAIAAVLAHAHVLAADDMTSAQAIAHQAILAGPWLIFVRAIFAGWLIALMVWLLPSAQGSAPAIILLITYVVAIGSFSHVIAGSVDVLFLHETGELTLSTYASHFLIPSLAGNMLGGILIVASLNYGQVAPELD